MGTTKAYTQTLRGEDIFKKVISDYEKDTMISSIDLELSVEEAGTLFLNKLFQKKLSEESTFASYTLVLLQENMDRWKLEENIKEKFGAFKISQRFIDDKEILSALHYFEKLIAT
jgi:hypothetical protein